MNALEIINSAFLHGFVDVDSEKYCLLEDLEEAKNWLHQIMNEGAYLGVYYNNGVAVPCLR